MKKTLTLAAVISCFAIANSQSLKWTSYGSPGEHKGTVAGIGGAADIIGDRLYTVESSGKLYESLPPNYGKLQLGKSDFGATKFMFYTDKKLYTIETSGSLYEVLPADGSWKQLGKSGDWKATIAGAVLNGSLYTAESTGILYRTNLMTGEWQQIGKPDFGNTKFMVAANTMLYTIEKDGTLYEINPTDGTWKQRGKPGDWVATVHAVVCWTKMYSIESDGSLYQTDLHTGTWKLVGKIDFKPAFLMSSDWGYLYAIDSSGNLYGYDLLEKDK